VRTATHRLGWAFGFLGNLGPPQAGSNANVVGVSPEELKQLRKELSCTAKELALTLGVEPKEFAAWEAGELFPTKRYVSELEALRKKGSGAIVRAPKGKAGAAKVGMARLADAKLWELVRKLVEHPALFDQVTKLADAYPDPSAPAAKPDAAK
jgi:DNA-binding XRE family transcriptional regulator